MRVSTIQNRLIEMMSTLNISQTDISNKTGVLKSSLSNWISGRRIPRQDQISAIADPYDINPTWLMGYDVPMYMSKLTDDELTIISAYKAADHLEQQMVLKILNISK